MRMADGTSVIAESPVGRVSRRTVRKGTGSQVPQRDDDTSVLSLLKDILLEETTVHKEDIIRWIWLFLPDEITTSRVRIRRSR
jgi:hypothetical protein